MIDRVAKLNDVLPDEWASQYGLKALERGEPYGVSELVDRRTYGGVLAAIENDPRASFGIFDHARKYRIAGGPRHVAVITTAPYVTNTLSQYRDSSAANARIHEIAQALGLYVRVGHPGDVTYLSQHDEIPTIPIVWWQPARFAMPLPHIENPNPRYADRMPSA